MSTALDALYDAAAALSEQRGPQYPWVWTREHRPAGRAGQRCRRTGMNLPGNTTHVEFMDGKCFIVEAAGLKHA